MKIEADNKRKKRYQQAHTDAFCIFTYLQPVIFPLQCLGVLGQADLFQPPGDGAIIHV